MVLYSSLLVGAIGTLVPVRSGCSSPLPVVLLIWVAVMLSCCFVFFLLIFVFLLAYY
jgi:hypothetical protein